MRLEIKNKEGILRTIVSPDENSKLTHAAMGEHVLSLSFTIDQYIALEVDDYIDFEGNRYTLLENYHPTMKSLQEWSYSPKFYGIESELKRALVLKMVDGEDDPIFPLTAPAREHVARIVDNINRIKKTTDWKVGEVIASENIVMAYNGTYCYDALTELANQLETEWWVEGTTINLTRCEFGAPIALGYKNGLKNLFKDENENAKFFTRLFPIGSSRNIVPSDYGSTRLQLPNGQKYVEQNLQFGIIEHFEEAAFSHIYPRRIGTVSSVRTQEYNNDAGEPFTVYYFEDSGLSFDPNDYEMAGLVKMIVFQSGELNGRDFEVNYNSDTKEFEVINQYPEGYDQLPGGQLIPEVGDEYILYNLRMPQEYYPLAEKEYKEAVDAYMEKHRLDKSIYRGDTDYIDIAERGLEIKIGQAVRLESQQFFPGIGYRVSRVVSITKSIVRPTEMTLSFSDVIAKGKFDKINESIAEMMTFARERTLPDLIRSWENTLPTDYNLFSALRSMKEFINKKNDDTAQGIITFLQGVKMGKYTPGVLGSGGAVLIDKDGNSTGEFDYLRIRKKAVFTEIDVQELKHIGGEFIVSPAAMVVSSVEELEDVYRCYFTTTDSEGEKIYNQFSLGDQARCQTFNLERQADGTLGNHYYWRLVVAVGENFIDLSKADCDKGSDVPRDGDRIAQLGNRTDATRQNAQIFSAFGYDAPSYKQYTGIDSYSLEDKYQTGFTSKGNKVQGDLILTTGEDVKVKFEVLEEYIRSEISSIKNDLIGYGSLLHNSYFNQNLIGWETEGDVVLFMIGDKWIWVNDSTYSEKRAYVGIVNDLHRSVLFIKNRSLIQRNVDFETHPVFEVKNEDGLLLANTFYVEFYYRCVTPGTLKIEFLNADKTGFEDFEILSVEQEIEVTEDYQTFEASGLWNGTGDFKISFSGEMYIYAVRLAEDRVSDIEQRFNTLYEQSDRWFRFLASNFNQGSNKRWGFTGDLKLAADTLQIDYSAWEDDSLTVASMLKMMADKIHLKVSDFNEDGTIKTEAGVLVKSDVASLYAIGNDGEIKSFIGASTDGIKLKAKNITFEGLVTANENFKILEDGSIDAKNAKLSGRFESNTAGDRIIIEGTQIEKGIKFLTRDDNSVGDMVFVYSGVPGRGQTTSGFLRFQTFTEEGVRTALSGITPESLSFYVIDDNDTASKKIDIGIDEYGNAFIWLNGIPTSSVNVDFGYVYIENGFLKLKTQ